LLTLQQQQQQQQQQQRRSFKQGNVTRISLFARVKTTLGIQICFLIQIVQIQTFFKQYLM
jgi:hypothetical protein